MFSYYRSKFVNSALVSLFSNARVSLTDFGDEEVTEGVMGSLDEN